MGNSNSSPKKSKQTQSNDAVFVELDSSSITYAPGELVSGKIHISLDVLDAFLLKGVYLHIRGEENISWTERHTHTVSDGKGGSTTRTTYSMFVDDSLFAEIRK